MEISQVRAAMPFLFPNADKETSAVLHKAGGDIVDVHMPELIADEDVDGVLNETISMIGSDNAGALSVHSGLNQARVFALLGL